MREYIDTPNGLIAIDEGEILYRVEGAGGDPGNALEVLQTLEIDIGGDDLGPSPCEGLGRGPPDALRRPRHKDRAPVQAVHGGKCVISHGQPPWAGQMRRCRARVSAPAERSQACTCKAGSALARQSTG